MLDFPTGQISQSSLLRQNYLGNLFHMCSSTPVTGLMSERHFAFKDQLLHVFSDTTAWHDLRDGNVGWLFDPPVRSRLKYQSWMDCQEIVHTFGIGGLQRITPTDFSDF